MGARQGFVRDAERYIAAEALNTGGGYSLAARIMQGLLAASSDSAASARERVTQELTMIAASRHAMRLEEAQEYERILVEYVASLAGVAAAPSENAGEDQ